MYNKDLLFIFIALNVFSIKIAAFEKNVYSQIGN
jgi:hypothetical protein